MEQVYQYEDQNPAWVQEQMEKDSFWRAVSDIEAIFAQHDAGDLLNAVDAKVYVVIADAVLDSVD